MCWLGHYNIFDRENAGHYWWSQDQLITNVIAKWKFPFYWIKVFNLIILIVCFFKSELTATSWPLSMITPYPFRINKKRKEMKKKIRESQRILLSHYVVRWGAKCSAALPGLPQGMTHIVNLGYTHCFPGTSLFANYLLNCSYCVWRFYAE